MILYRCDLCGSTSTDSKAIETVRLYADGSPGRGKHLATHRLDACQACSTALSLRLPNRGTGRDHGGSRNRASCRQCSAPGYAHVRLYRRGEGGAAPGRSPKDYTHTGALCQRHFAPLISAARRA